MAPGQIVESLYQEMTCPICQSYFKDPVILDCGHNVCQGCLNPHQRGFGMTACCPQCPESDQRKSFRTNWQLAKVVELVKKLHGEKEAEQQVCAKHEEPLDLFCKEDQVPICVMCRRSKEHREHDICSREKEEEEGEESATKAYKVNFNQAIRYLKMGEEELMELCLEKGLDREGLSIDELRVILIQQASQLEPATVKSNAKRTQACGPELQMQKNSEPKEKTQFIKLRVKQKEQLTAQANERKGELERVYLKERQANEPIPWVFPCFSPGENPACFLAAFERTCKQWNKSREDAMEYLPGLLRGRLAEVYHEMSSQNPVTLQAFREAVFKQFSFDPDHFCKEFWALKPQHGVSLLEFGAKLEETLCWWLDNAKADDREKVIRLMALNQFCSHLPDHIKHSVKAKAPKTISQAAQIANQLMLGREEQHQVSQNVANSQEFKKRACLNCGERGHLRTSCPSSSKRVYRVTAFSICGEERSPTDSAMQPVLLGNQLVIALLSTGSEFSLVSSDLVSPSDIIPGESVDVQPVNGSPFSLPVACLQMNWRDTNGLVAFGVTENLFVPLILGLDMILKSCGPFSWGPEGFIFSKKPKATDSQKPTS
nr:uncharacterized protein LOC132765209 [Anolis sagrei ordinatus]